MKKEELAYLVQRDLERGYQPQKFGTFEDNVFYHATDGRYLQEIASKGLQPGDGRNWKGMTVGKAVYLWPSAGIAWQYREDLKQRGTGQMRNPIMLRIENLDRNKLGPDHESFLDELQRLFVWEAGDDFHEEDRNELLAASPALRRIVSATDDEKRDESRRFNFQNSLVILSELPFEIKIKYAQRMSDRTEPLMYDGPIHASQISIAKTKTLSDEVREELEQQFQRNHDYDPNDDEQYHQYIEAFEEWLYAQEDWIDADDFEEQMRYYYEDIDDSTSELFNYEPVKQQYPDQSGQLSLLGATSEDTEPEGLEVGFLRDPHPTLYPCLWENMKMKPEALKKLKNHVLNAIELEFQQPDQFIYFTMYGSGASYNWDEAGDADLQMWVDISKFNELHEDEHDLDQDDLVAAIRRIVQPINFPSFADLGLSTQDCAGEMLIQYYPKPGTGSKSENMAQKPYACYDMETNEWIVRPKPIRPQFYGDAFLMVEPKAQDIATQAEAAIDELQRNIVDWQFWYAMWNHYKNHSYKERFEDARAKAEEFKESVQSLFEGVFGGRADAYSEQGKGIEDERDITQKLLEVWGIFQKLKHFARQPLPWEEQEMPELPGDSASDPEDKDNDQKDAHESSISGWSGVVKFYPVTKEEFEAAKSKAKRAWNLSELPDDSAPFLTKDKQTGFAIAPDGEIQNIFNLAGQGRGKEAVKEAIRLGGHWLNAFDGFLTDFYKDLGFQEVDRMKFDPQYKPDDMPDEEGTPDVLIMRYARLAKITRMLKNASWKDIMEKAQNIRNDGGVQLTLNAPDHVTGTVASGTEKGKQYDTEIWRDDPNSGSITQWNCSCPWSDYSWGRTRQWKKYEGRPCAHTLALYWTSISTPSDYDQQGNEQLQMGDQGQMNPPASPAPDSTLPPGTMPPGVVQEGENPLDWLTGPNTPGGANTPIIPLDNTPEIQTPPPLVQPAFSQPIEPGKQLQLEFPGTFSNWKRTSAFQNGDMVRNKVPVQGEDRDGSILTVPRNSVGEVLWADDKETICMFPLTKNGPLEPHLVRVQDSTSKFYLSPNMNAGPRRRN